MIYTNGDYCFVLRDYMLLEAPNVDMLEFEMCYCYCRPEVM